MCEAMNRRITCYFLIIILLVSCKNREYDSSSRTIFVNIDNICELRLKDGKKTQLDTALFIGQIKQIASLDSIIILHTGDYLYGIDPKSGSLTTTYSRKGRSDEEYVSLLGFWNEADTLVLYDFEGRKLLYYNLNGAFIKSVSLSEDKGFQQLCPIGESGHYIGRRVYGIGEIPELSLYDAGFNFERPVGPRMLHSGIKLNYPFFNTGHSALYSSYFLNDIEEITDSTIAVKYNVDFGKYNFCNSSSKDDFEFLFELNSSKHAIATYISNLFESDNRFCFQFVLKDCGLHYCVYNRISREACVFKFVGDNESVETIITADDSVIVIASDDQGAYSLYSFQDFPNP